MPVVDTAPLERALFGEVLGVIPVALYDALQLLTARERLTIELRFGMRDGKTRSLDEVGKLMKVSKERIRHLENVGLEKMKHAGGLAGYLILQGNG